MSEKHPPTLDYRGPQKQPPPNHQERSAGTSKFFLGFILSIGLSALVWVVAGGVVFSQGELAVDLLILLGFIKLAAAIVLILYTRYRPVGFGILFSLPIAGMIFIYGGCATIHWGHP